MTCIRKMRCVTLQALEVKITLHKITVKENIWNSYIPSTKIGQLYRFDFNCVSLAVLFNVKQIY